VCSFVSVFHVVSNLEHTVTQLQNELEDVKRVKEELENRQLLVTQEKTNLEGRMEELVNKYENMSTINSKILEHLYKFYISSKCVVLFLCFMSFQISGEEYFFGL
jgi:regulator of replication initiation timing